MSEFKIVKKINVSDSPVTKVILNPYNQNQLISTCLDGIITIWKLPKLADSRELNFKFVKLTCLVPFVNSTFRGFLAGVRNGQLTMLNENFEIIKSVKLHQECISQIIVSNESIVTISYDGRIIFWNKQTLQKIHQINLQNPLFSAVEYQNHLYIASMTSYIVSLGTFAVVQTNRYNVFTVNNDQIFGCSDDRGLSCLNSNSNNYIPAQFILPYQRKIIIFSQKSICVANPSKKLNWKAKKYSQFSAGETITTGFTENSNIYVGGNQGNLYWIQQSKQTNSLSS